MTVTPISLYQIEHAIREVYFALNKKSHQMPFWGSMTEKQLWRELVACILGSRVRFEIAYAALERIENRRLLDQSRRSSCFNQYELDLIGALSGEDLWGCGTNTLFRYPFFRVRANQIRRAAERLFGLSGSIREFLDDAGDVRKVRRRLASEVSGLGPKQASLFLRNIGYANQLAVLDVHVLTYMNWVGLIDMPLTAVSTVGKYEMLEEAFIERSSSLGYTPDRFDLAVWVVVKVAKEEYKTWGS